MRSYKVYGIKDGGAEEYVATAHNAAEGKAIHIMMLDAQYYETMIVRNVLGGFAMRKELKKEVDPA
jgi:hypothetical protein